MTFETCCQGECHTLWGAGEGQLGITQELRDAWAVRGLAASGAWSRGSLTQPRLRGVVFSPDQLPLPKLHPSTPLHPPPQGSAQKMMILNVWFKICFSDFAFCFCSCSGSPGNRVGHCCLTLKLVNRNFTFYRDVTLGLGASRKKTNPFSPKMSLTNYIQRLGKIKDRCFKVFVENTKILIFIPFFKAEGSTPPFPQPLLTSHPALSIFTGPTFTPLTNSICSSHVQNSSSGFL